jgi:hypothetical protein
LAPRIFTVLAGYGIQPFRWILILFSNSIQTQNLLVS